MAARKALDERPHIPGIVLAAILNAVRTVQAAVYPQASLPPVEAAFWLHYSSWVATFMPQVVDLDRYASVAPDDALLMAVCVIAAILAGRSPHEGPNSDGDVPTIQESPEAFLDGLTALANNTQGPNAASGFLTEITRDALDRLRKPDDPEWDDRGQEALLHTSFAFGGPTPQLIESIVKTGKAPYVASGLGLDAAEVLRYYAEAKEKYQRGLSIPALARVLAQKAWPGSVVMLALMPFLLPPAVSTALWFRLAATHADWVAFCAEFLERIAERDKKREQRSPLGSALSLDEEVQSKDGSRPRHETIVGETLRDLPEEELNALLDQLQLTRRQREVAVLLSAGLGPAEIASQLSIDKGQVTRLIRAIRRKVEKLASKFAP